MKIFSVSSSHPNVCSEQFSRTLSPSSFQNKNLSSLSSSPNPLATPSGIATVHNSPKVSSSGSVQVLSKSEVICAEAQSHASLLPTRMEIVSSPKSPGFKSMKLKNLSMVKSVKLHEVLTLATSAPTGSS